MRNTCRKKWRRKQRHKREREQRNTYKKKTVKERKEIIIGDEDAEGKQVKATWRRRKDVRRNST